MAATYTMRQARMDLGERIVTNLEDEDIDVLFEDVGPEPELREIESGPEGRKIKTLQYGADPFMENKDNRKRMEAARRELIAVIRKWMHEAKESPV